MKFKLQIEMDNAAFDDPRELARILKQLAADLDGFSYASGQSYNVRDVNGNTVGVAKITGRR